MNFETNQEISQFNQENPAYSVEMRSNYDRKFVKSYDQLAQSRDTGFSTNLWTANQYYALGNQSRHMRENFTQGASNSSKCSWGTACDSGQCNQCDNMVPFQTPGGQTLMYIPSVAWNYWSTVNPGNPKDARTYVMNNYMNEYGPSMEEACIYWCSADTGTGSGAWDKNWGTQCGLKCKSSSGPQPPPPPPPPTTHCGPSGACTSACADPGSWGDPDCKAADNCYSCIQKNQGCNFPTEPDGCCSKLTGTQCYTQQTFGGSGKCGAPPHGFPTLYDLACPSSNNS